MWIKSKLTWLMLWRVLRCARAVVHPALQMTADNIRQLPQLSRVHASAVITTSGSARRVTSGGRHVVGLLSRSRGRVGDVTVPYGVVEARSRAGRFGGGAAVSGARYGPVLTASVRPVLTVIIVRYLQVGVLVLILLLTVVAIVIVHRCVIPNRIRAETVFTGAERGLHHQ